MTLIQKSPYVQDNFYVDFTNQLDVNNGEVIEQFSVTAISAFDQSDQTAEVIAQDPVPFINGNVVTFWYEGGVVGQNYVIQVQVVTSEGRKLEGNIDLVVQIENASAN